MCEKKKNTISKGLLFKQKIKIFFHSLFSVEIGITVRNLNCNGNYKMPKKAAAILPKQVIDFIPFI